MKTRIPSRLIQLGRLSAAIILAGTVSASAWGQPDDGNSPNARAMQQLNNLLQQAASPAGGAPDNPPGARGFMPAGAAPDPGPTFDLEVFGGHIVRPPGDTNRPLANTVDDLVNFLREKITNFNVIESAGVSGVRLDNLKLRAVNALTVLNILPTITDNKVEARTIWGAPGARGRRGGPPGTGAGNGIVGSQPGVVYRLDLVPAVNLANGAETGGGGGGAPAAPDAQPRQMAVFNVNNYFSELARHGKTDEKAIGIELMGVESLIGDSLERLKGSPLTPDERPQFEVHYGAGIVIVIGSAKAIDVATKIINALPGNAGNTSPASPATMSSSALFQRLDPRTQEYFMQHPGDWNDYAKMQAGDANASIDKYNRDTQASREVMQILQNTNSNPTGGGASVPAPGGGQ